MIIKGREPAKRPVWKIAVITLLLIGGAVLLFQNSRDNKTSEDIILCDAETVDEDGKFVNGIHRFNNGTTQTDEAAYSGKFSSKVTSEKKYSIGINYTDFDYGDEIEASVWCKSQKNDAVFVVATSEDTEEFYTQSNAKVEADKEWFRISLKFKVPRDYHKKAIKIYTYYTGQTDVAYLDDFTIKNITSSTTSTVAPTASLTDMDIEEGSLQFSIKAKEKLNKKRSEAMTLGLLVKGEDDWVKAKLNTTSLEETEVKVRLKGDWTDHLKGDFWSFRIKMPAEKSWNRMMTFSIQNPVTRGYLMEWVFHQMLEYEDILTPRYDFVKLKVGDSPARLHAYEEHFDKQLAEYKNRREGVILKFDEDEFWDLIRKDKKNSSGVSFYTNNSESQSTISTFKSGKIAKTEKLMEQFTEASSLLYGFQQQQISPDRVFDLDRLAKYYAICEVLKAYHSTIWHNMRYYYDPVLRRLEPIGFDGYTDTGVYDWHGNAFYGAYRSTSLKTRFEDPAIFLFQNKDFNEKYCRYLYDFSSEDYLNGFISAIRSELDERVVLINSLKPGYDYGTDKILKTARNIRSSLEVTDDISLKVYAGPCQGDSCYVKATNFHPVPLQVIGFSKTRNQMTEHTGHALVYSNRRSKAHEYKTLAIPKGQKYIHYKIAGLDSTYTSAILPWPSPSIQLDETTDRTILATPSPSDNLEVSAEQVTFGPGTHTLSEPLRIPADKALHIQAGAELNLIGKAYILSYGPVHMHGTASAPIQIHSSDKSSQGIHILDTHKRSSLRHVQFNDLNTLSEGFWQMTGAVTFYEAPVDLDHVTISHNLCEDALNIIRTDFTATALNINHTFADGFDADFCHGKLTNSRFTKTGNDGIDFSGSKIRVENLHLNNIGDKGISAGEESTLDVGHVTIDGASIGVASKDLSVVTISDITLTNCDKGFAAYQKKPEFGPAKITVKKYNAENVTYLQIAENGSTIILPVPQ